VPSPTPENPRGASLREEIPRGHRQGSATRGGRIATHCHKDPVACQQRAALPTIRISGRVAAALDGVISGSEGP